MRLMQKMGWRPGEGLGPDGMGNLEPLLLDVKNDRKGELDRRFLFSFKTFVISFKFFITQKVEKVKARVIRRTECWLRI